MTRRRVLAGAAILFAVFAWRVVVWRPAPVAGPPPDDGYARLGGVVHVHTTLSDGGGTPDEVMAAARAAGLGFVAITDHNTLAAKPVEGYHQGLLVLVGAEISTTAGHVVALGIPDPGFRFSGDARDVLADVRDLGGAAFAAHPVRTREDLRWTGWDLPGSWGLEVLNGDSAWRSAGMLRVARAVFAYPLNRSYALLTPFTSPDEATERWDRALAERDVPAAVGADAHQRVELGHGIALGVPSYEAVFRTLRQYAVLDEAPSGQAVRDVPAVARALARGRSYAALQGLADAGGFSFVAEGGTGRATMGDTIAPAGDLVLRVSGRLPERASVRVLHDGRPLVEGPAPLVVPAAAEGVYRAEVRLAGSAAPWIIANPIYVFAPEAAAARRARAEWPAPDPVPEPAALIDDFEAGSVFETGADTASLVERTLVPGEGMAGGTAARLRFRLGQPTDGHPDVFAAMVSFAPRDLSGRRGIVFSLRADGVYRLWFQVRDENPASRDDATEWWFTSVKTGPDWRRVAVPFDRLRSINPATDGRLDLDAVRALVFVIDKGAMPPGSAGTVWIDDVGVY